MKKNNSKLLIVSFLVVSVFTVFSLIKVNNSKAEDNLAERLSGKILLQVEKNGEAWYVSPDNDNKRVFLNKPEQAFMTMVQYGVGIRSVDLRRIPVSLDYLSGHDSDGDGLPDDFEKAYGTNHLSADSDSDGYNDLLELNNNYDPNYGNAYKLSYDESFAEKNKGRIFIDVEQGGAAWYLSPENNKRYYLGRPDNAFQIMKNLGIGISNENLSKISVESSQSYYANNEFGFSFELTDSWKNYLTSEHFTDFNYDNNNYQVREIIFGLQPIAKDLENDYYNLTEESFTNMFTIYVINNSDYQYMINKGYKFAISDYMHDLVKMGNNNYYTFLRDKDIFENSYNNDYIYDKKQEASIFLNNINIYDVDFSSNLDNRNEISYLCKNDYAAAAGGGSIYPVADKYKHLDNFGPLFTSSICENKRIQEIPGVTGDYYYHGSFLKLNSSPSPSLLANLRLAGYHCNYTRISDENCTEWILDEVTSLSSVMKLKSYVSEIKSDDCVMCGEAEDYSN